MTIASDLDQRRLRAVHGVLLPGFNGTEPPAWLDEAPGLAGVLLFAHNASDPASAQHLARALHRDHPDLLVGSDEEGGDVTRIQARDGSSLPGAWTLGVLDDLQSTRAAGAALGGLLHACGIDIALGPDVDVTSRPDNPVIGVRSLGTEPQAVARHGAALIAGLQQVGVAACAKHFPGHGDTAVDSHTDLPTLAADLPTLGRRDLPPFRAAVETGVAMVMTGHLRAPALDADRPASLSPQATRLLRAPAAQGLGFQGVVVTDALDMGALHTGAHGPGIGQACVQAVQAGADLLCLGNPSQPGADPLDDAAIVASARTALLAALEQGQIRLEQLEASVARLDALRSTLRTRRGAQPALDLPGAEATMLTLGRDLAHRAITAPPGADLTLRPGDLLIDARRRPDNAAGAATAVFAHILARDLGLQEVSLTSLEHARLPAGRRALVITKEPGAHVQALLAHLSDPVVVHTGVPQMAPAAASLINAYGVGRVNAEAVVALCRL